MPNVKPNEKRKDFVSRCIPIVLQEGTAKDGSQAAAICNSMFDEAKKSFEPELTALKMLKMMEGDMLEYARAESWDIMDACNALIQMANLARAEIHEEDISKIAKIMKQICDYISGEIKQMENHAKDGQAQAETEMEAPEEMPMMEKSFAQVKSLDLSYAKSLGIELPDMAVKYVAKDEIKGYTFLWGNPALTDVELEYFTPETDFWDGALGKSARPLTWDHAQDKSFDATPVIGQIVDFGDDEIGRWYVAKMDRAHKYRAAIDALIKQGKLGTSSDSAPQYVQREKRGKATWLKEWAWFASALTDTPAEPRMIGSLEFLKSIGVELPDVSDVRSRYEHKKRTAEFLKLKQFT